MVRWAERVLVALLAASVVTCGSSGGGGGATTPVTYTLPSTTQTVDTKNESAVVSVSQDGGTVVLDASSDVAKSVAEGGVLLFGITSKTPNGMLRKVVSKTASGGQVLLTTTQAKLEDAFQDLHLTVHQAVDPATMQSWTPRASGLSLKRSALTVEGSAGAKFDVDFADTVLYDADGDPVTTDDQVVLNGSTSFSLSLDLEVDIGWFKVEKFKFGPTIEQEGNVTVSTTLPAWEYSKSIPVATLYFPPFAVGPVVIMPQIEFLVGVDGKLEAQVSSEVNESMTLSGGIQYQDGQWQPYSQLDATFDFKPPHLSASGDVKAYAGPIVGLMIYGVAGPYVQVDGYVELSADIDKDPWWELAAGVEGIAGAKGEILGFVLVEFKTDDFIGYRKVLADAGGPFTQVTPGCPDTKDCSGRECGPDPVCGQSCGTCSGGKTCDASGQCVAGGCTTNCGEMVQVPAGPFWQGCNAAVDTECSSAEKPYHEVNVPGFRIDKYEVTVGLYGDCVTAGVCTALSTGGYCNWNKAGKEEHPVNCITWYQAREYCAWAGKRLCSESEWEKASRGTDGRKYPWGNATATCQYAVMKEGGYGCGTDSTMAVGSKPAGASPYGALDMSGNVWEWVEDDWHSDYTGAPTNGSAWVDEPRASNRVERGGGFYHGYAAVLRSSYRYDLDPSYGYDDLGARCCRSP